MISISSINNKLISLNNALYAGISYTRLITKYSKLNVNTTSINIVSTNGDTNN